MINILSFEFNLAAENTYIIYKENKEAIFIDCGAATREDWALILQQIDKYDLQPTLSLATHFHFDHVWGAGYVLETFKLQTMVPEVDLRYLPSLKTQLEAFGIVQEQAYSDEVLFQTLDTNCSSLLGEALEILELPGHSPGHLGFYFKDSDALFSGDVLFRSGIGRTDLWGGSFEELKNSIRDKIYILPPHTRVYPGHGPETTVAEEKMYNPFVRQ